MSDKPFSIQLEAWFKRKNNKTLKSLLEMYSEKSFAVAFILLLIVPALPIPTGGITHIFELAAMLLAMELIVGRNTIWLPKRWESMDLTKMSGSKVTSRIVRLLKLVERHSKPRLTGLLKSQLFIRATGFILLLFCITAFLAPPFSGLDTLPSVAVVLIGLAFVFEDVLLYAAGLVAGMIGIGLVVAVSAVLVTSLRWF